MVIVVNELDLLRHSAEQSLVDMLELLFSRLPQLQSDTCNDIITTDQVLMLPNEGIHYRPLSVNDSLYVRGSHDQRS